MAKEGIELVYNIRDANLDRGLAWNCLFSTTLYTQAQSELSLEDNICDTSFGSGYEEGKILRVSYSPNQYIFYDRVEEKESFLENFDETKLYYYSGSYGPNDEEDAYSLSIYSHEA